MGWTPAHSQQREYTYDELGNRVGATNQIRFTSTAGFHIEPRRALPGDLVNVYGRNFPAGNNSAVSVSFNGVNGIVQSVSTRVITVEVPIGVSDGPVVVTHPGGTSQVGGFLFEGVSVTPPVVDVDFSEAVQFTGTVAGATNVTLRWLVEGIEGGNASVGTIDSTGLYTAPAGAVGIDFPFLIEAVNDRLGQNGYAQVRPKCGGSNPILDELMVPGIVTLPFQRDCYEFDVLAGKWAYVACMGSNALSGLILRDAEGEVIASIGQGTELRLGDHQLLEEGTYRIEVLGSSSGTGTYDLWLDTHDTLPLGQWLFPGDGVWSDPDNWSRSTLPTLNDDVVVGSTPTPVEVTVNAATASCSSLDTAGGLTIANSGVLEIDGDLIATGVVNFFSGRLRGARIPAGTSLVLTGNPTFESVTLDADLQLMNRILYIESGLTVNGVLTLGSSGQYGYLQYRNDQTLGGAGEILMNNDSAYIYRATPGSILTIEAPLLIHGQGFIGSGSGPIVNRTIIRSDRWGRTIRVNDTSTTGWRNQGLLEGVNGGSLDLQGNNWSNEGQIDVSGGGDLYVAGTNWSATPTSSIQISNGDLTLGGTFVHSGTVTANSSSVNLAGTFQLSDVGSFSVTGGPVRLTGTLDNVTDLDITSFGVPFLLQGGSILGGRVYPAGENMIVTASNSVLDDVKLETDLLVDGNRVLYVDNGIEIDGTVTLGGNGYGYLRYRGSQTFSGSGEIVLQSEDSYIYQGQTGSVLTLASPLLVSGRGHIGSGNSPFINQSTIRSDRWGGTIFLYSSGGWSNEGVIEGKLGGSIDCDGIAWANEGQVCVDGGGTLQVEGSNWTGAVGSSFSVSNSLMTMDGTYTQMGSTLADNSEVHLKGSFMLSDLGAFTVTGGPVRLKGELDNVSDLDLNGFGVPLLLDGGAIRGGSVYPAGQQVIVTASNSVLDGVTLESDLLLDNNQILYVEGGLTINGTLTVGQNGYGYLRYRNDQTFDGSGQIVLNNTSSYIYQGLSGSELTLAPPLLVRGVGNIGSGNSPFINQTTIRSDVPGSSIVITSNGGWTNSGLIEAVNGASLTLDGTAWINQSQIDVSGGGGLTARGAGWSSSAAASMSVTDGPLSLEGTYVQSGTLTATNSVVDLKGEFTLPNLGNITVTGGPVKLSGILTNTTDLDLTGFGVPLELNGGEIVGGSVYPAGTLLEVTSSNAILDGVTLECDLLVEGNRVLRTESALTINGRITVGGNGYGYIQYTGSQTYDGNGEILLNHPSSYIYRQTSGSTLTFANSMVVRGQGNLGSGDSPFVNLGLIRSEVPGASIVLNSSTGWENHGTIEAINGAHLNLGGNNWSNHGVVDVIDGGNLLLSGTGWSNESTASMSVLDGYLDWGGAFDQQGTITATNSQVDLDGVSFDLADLGAFSVTGGPVRLGGVLDNSANLDLNALGAPFELRGGTIIGGSIGPAGASMEVTATNSILDMVTFDADLLAQGNVSLFTTGGLTVNGTMTLGGSGYAHLRFSGSQAYGGTGDIYLNHNSSYIYTGLANSTLTLAPPLLVHGGGYIGSGASPVINQATIRADRPGSGIYITSSSGWTNQGLIECTTGNFLNLSGNNWLNDTTGTIRVASGTMAMSGTWSSNGVLNLAQGVTASVSGAMGFGAQSRIELEAAGTNSGEYSSLSSTGTATLAGDLHIDFLYSPTVGDTLSILSHSGTPAGSFATITGTDPGSGPVNLSPTYGAGTSSVTVQ